MQYAVNLILEQYITLTEYFMLCETDPKINHDVILTAPQDPITQIYLEFLSHALDTYSESNANFQSEILLLHTLKNEVKRMVRNFFNHRIACTWMKPIL